MEGVEFKLRLPILIQFVGHKPGQRLVHLAVEIRLGARGGFRFLFGLLQFSVYSLEGPALRPVNGVQEGERSVLFQGNGDPLLVVDAVAVAGHLAALVVGG